MASPAPLGGTGCEVAGSRYLTTMHSPESKKQPKTMSSYGVAPEFWMLLTLKLAARLLDFVLGSVVRVVLETLVAADSLQHASTWRVKGLNK